MVAKCNSLIEIRCFRALAAVVAICVAAGSLPLSAIAAPNSKVMSALINGAQKEFDSGNFSRAGDLFLEIWHQDKTQVGALYNAARAHHLAGKLDDADDLYRQLLEPGRLDESAASKVRRFMVDLQAGRTKAKADEADRAEKSGKYALAAQLWSDVVQAAPQKYAWVLRAARAEHLAGHAEAALAGYNRILAESPTDATERSDALRWRMELSPAVSRTQATKAVARTSAAVTPPRQAPMAASTVQAADEESSVTGIVALVAGSIGVAAGGVVLGMAASDDSKLQARYAESSPDGKIHGISVADGQTEGARIESQYRVGWMVVGGSAVVAGLGTWLVLRSGTQRVSVVPEIGGARVTILF